MGVSYSRNKVCSVSNINVITPSYITYSRWRLLLEKLLHDRERERNVNFCKGLVQSI